jgi:hypothetical protein
MLRHCGLAARFVSGYLIQLTPDVKALDGPSGTEVDFTDLHAWCEVYLPGAGWVGLDPPPACWPAKATSRWPAPRSPRAPRPSGRCRQGRGGVQPRDEGHTHLRVAARHQTLHRGTVGRCDGAGRAGRRRPGARGCAPDHGRRADLRRRHRPRRRRVEHRRAGPDQARLRHRTGPQAAQDEYGQGGFLHFGQGKWYPGEQLPRWALNIYWRDRRPDRSGATRPCSPTNACPPTTPAPMRAPVHRRPDASAWA